MKNHRLKYTGERLVPGDERLKSLLIEDLAKFHFVSQYTVGKYVLDAGCGAGQGSAYLLKTGAHYVVGVDVSSEAIMYAKNLYAQQNLAFAVMDVLNLGFPSCTFDFVTSIEVIEHLTNPERYLAEIRRVLKDQGMLALSTPNKSVSSPTPGTMWPYHVREFYPHELEILLKKYFSRVEIWGMSIPIYENHPVRRLVHWLAPFFKPILPRPLRLRALPTLQRLIKANLDLSDVSFSRSDINKSPTIVVLCHV